MWFKMVWLFSEGFASFSVSFEVCAYAMIDIQEVGGTKLFKLKNPW